MKEFLMKTVSDKDDKHGIKVSRTRTSTGHCSIYIEVGNKRIVFDNEDSKGGFGEGYEMAAQQAAEMLDAIANDPCLIPKDK